MRILILFFVCNTLWHHTTLPTENYEDGHGSTKHITKRTNNKSKYPDIGKVIDKLNGIPVYYNGPIANVQGRNITADGYNLGLRYQCVEFVKRYYYEYYNHRMPNTYGHAREFFNSSVSGASFNRDRGLMQYRNRFSEKPQVGDIFVFRGTRKNPYGHIGIVSMVGSDRVEMIQQNVGKHTRNLYRMHVTNGNYYVEEEDLLGWMRKEN